MGVYFGHEPILDRKWNTAGYELLFDSCDCRLGSPAAEPAEALPLVLNAVMEAGIDRLYGSKKAFISTDRSLLLQDWNNLLPPERAVIELIETIPPDDEVLGACKNLASQGYVLALHAAQNDVRTAIMAPFAGLIKVDVQTICRDDQERIVGRYRKGNTGIIAEGIWTDEEFRAASKVGYDYFQGYFFGSPGVLKTPHVLGSQLTNLRLLKEIQTEDLDLRKLEELIRYDVSLSHSLLAYLNSAAFRWANRIGSVRQALALLGSNDVRRWVFLANLAILTQSRPPVLVSQVLMRGRFADAIATLSKAALGGCDPFLGGMFSLLDVILERPLEVILRELNIDRRIEDALLGNADERDPLSLILNIVKSYEAGNWVMVDAAAKTMGLAPEALSAAYVESLTWVEAFVAPEEHKWRSIHGSPPIGGRMAIH